MATSQLKRVIDTLHRATLPHEGAALTDGQLLESYISSREEAAFSALVRRHGPMVWSVCRRILRRHQDVEDAFQATFLVLVRKAAAIAQKELVGNWLYGVAQQTAVRARATAARRSVREKQVTTMPEPAAPEQDLQDNLQALLDQELSRLPDKYRAVIVLCDLEGKTRKEAARHFHLPEGTVATRLATARTMLSKRLARHGLAVSGAALTALLSQNVAPASVPASVASSTIKAATAFAAGQATAAGVISVKAVALAEGVLKTMLLNKLKIVTAVLLLAALSATAVALTQRSAADQSANQPVNEKQLLADNPADQAGKEKADLVLRPAEEKKEPAVQPAKEPADKNVSVEAAQVGGCEGALVKAIDAEKNTVTFDDKARSEVAGKTYAVAPDASILINGKPGKLAELPAGSAVSGILRVDQKTVGTIYAKAP